jgi:uncharacterized phage-associated protein
MAEDVRSVANVIIEKALQRSVEVSNLKLQKLIYFGHGWHFAFFDEPLVSIEFEAWDFGPVQPMLYEQFRKFGSGKIDQFSRKFNPITEKFEIPPVISNANAMEAIDYTLDRYLHLSASRLVELTHALGGPWHTTIENHRHVPNAGMKIKNSLIREYFSNLRKYVQKH